VLCVVQFVWTIQSELLTLGALGVGLSVAAVVLCNTAFEWLWRVGDRLQRRSASGSPPRRAAARTESEPQQPA
jgi:hypothetical protein